jgi:dTDP-4-dehydrorhamnose reductase
MEKIFVTGATGLLGSSLVPYLKKCGYHVVTHARSTQADYRFDLSDRIALHQLLNQIEPSVIINLAGLTNVELCETNVNLAYASNTRTVEHLVQWILNTGAECHLVQISTDHLYDGAGLHTEDDISITNNYAFSKYAGELAANRLPGTILRTNFVGRSQVSYRQSLTDWVYSSLTNAKNVQVLSDIYFSPLSITTLIEMIELVVQQKPVGVYNLGSHNGMSKADFDFGFAESLNLPTKHMTRIDSSQALFFKAYRPKDMRMDCSRIEQVLGVTLPDLQDLIQQMAEEYHEKD